MRGKGSKNHFIHLPIGITPAYAGKSLLCCASHFVKWDHPRLCGEKRSCKHDFHRVRRITPAYAGKSRIWIAVSGCRWDHPRLCGEKKVHCQPRNLLWGSPPPMRGKDVDLFHDKFLHGITPAYAGKSRRCNRRDI